MSAVAEAPARILGGPAEEKVVVSFFLFFKTARIHDENNATFKHQSESFLNALNTLLASNSEIAIKTFEGRYFVNDQLVRFDDTGATNAASVITEWQTLGLGGIVFKGAIDTEEMNRFMVFLSSARPNNTTPAALNERFKSANFTSMRLLALHEVGAGLAVTSLELHQQFRVSARVTFSKAMNTVGEIVSFTNQDRDINVSKTKRVVHGLIDHLIKDEASLLELAAIKDYDDYTYAHSTNVCIYSLTVGVRLGFDRPRLAQLGFSALFHDVGKVKLPKDLIAKPDAYDENDWVQMQRHPLLGAKTVLRNLKLDTYIARAARGAFEHHINNDYTGYPTLRYKKRPVTLFSKIIAIVDSFDALSSGRLYLKKALPPDEVLKKMQYQMAVKFDPFLLKLFTDIIGVYPVGSLVSLSTDELALIITNNEENRSRPCVKIVGNKEGLIGVPTWVDLSTPGNEHRQIVRHVDPKRYGLDIRQFILHD